MDQNQEIFMIGMLSLLKINISYYMNEISYLMNDLYKNSPDGNVTLIDYSLDQQLNSDEKILTLIFHRNHIPTISEVFNYIYNYINNVTINQIIQCSIKIYHSISILMKSKNSFKIIHRHRKLF